jgi:general L-amino acid transport system ATP-binding protein
MCLRDINLNVYKGERIIICGPSGSGKSTLIRCLNALEHHQDGDINILGVTLDNNVRNVEVIRRDVGMVFQQFNSVSASVDIWKIVFWHRFG